MIRTCLVGLLFASGTAVAQDDGSGADIAALAEQVLSLNTAQDDIASHQAALRVTILGARDAIDDQSVASELETTLTLGFDACTN
ncbi:MAG: hypothetical protein ACJAZO_002413 [Myxococcota bacterium]|jgi:hypothetical protein